MTFGALNALLSDDFDFSMYFYAVVSTKNRTTTERVYRIEK